MVVFYLPLKLLKTHIMKHNLWQGKSIYRSTPTSSDIWIVFPIPIPVRIRIPAHLLNKHTAHMQIVTQLFAHFCHYPRRLGGVDGELGGSQQSE